MLRLQSCLEGEAAEDRSTKRRFLPKCIETLFRPPGILLSAIKFAVGSDVRASRIQSLEIEGEDIGASKQTSASFQQLSFVRLLFVCLEQLWGWEQVLSR